MRAPLCVPTSRHALARRLGGCAAALALGLALAASPAASAPQLSGPAGTKASPSKPGGGATKSRATRKGRTTARRGAEADASGVELPGPLPELPQVDLGSFAALTGAELAASVSTAPPAGAPLAVVPAAEPAAPADPAIAAELPKPFAAFSRSATAMLDALTARARSQLGTRYVLGASSPGGALDCSAFTRFAMEALGLRLPRTAAQQAKVGVAVPRDRERLRPGDLLTFGSRRRVSHVGIYLGEGRFIHASVTSGQVIETTFAKNARLLRRWLGARRLLAGADSMPTTGG